MRNMCMKTDELSQICCALVDITGIITVFRHVFFIHFARDNVKVEKTNDLGQVIKSCIDLLDLCLALIIVR